jgi:hypothetical protein
MHFHLLKPLHGWRAFLGEVGVVVLGVLLALTAQQAAEALQWRSETATLRKSLHREIRDNQWNSALSVMISDCVRQRIKRFDNALAQAGAWHGDPMQAGGEQRWAALPPAFKFPSVEGFYTTGNWQTALTSGALAHMPEAERNGYSYTYQAMGDLRTLSIEQDRLAAELQPLARDQQLDGPQRLAFEAELASLDHLNALLTIYARKFLEGTRRGGITPRQADIENAYRLAKAEYGDCAQPLGSTTNALETDINSSAAEPEAD